jgi:hypothetical protein
MKSIPLEDLIIVEWGEDPQPEEEESLIPDPETLLVPWTPMSGIPRLS